MTKDEHVERLCYLYSKLPEMNAENLAYRIKFEALGKSDPVKLAAKLLSGAKVEAKAAEDEAIWAAAMAALKNADDE
jgi:type IV secretory pathway VirB6-like protein